MRQAVERFEMQANFEGLVQLLARNLYSSADAFVRELVQNAHDAIRLREQREGRVVGRIEIESRQEARELVFRDNGLGMSRREIRDFLSVIGSSGTGQAGARLAGLGAQAAEALIGRFGIGLLSAFLVAERVELRTRKLGARRGFLWQNDGSAACALAPADVERVGTEITLCVAPAYTGILDERALTAAVVRYCDFIPYPIFLNGSGPVNAMHAPWHLELWNAPKRREDALRAFVQSRYPDLPLEVIPVSLEAPVQVRGVLFITHNRAPGFNSGGVVDVYVRRMFVRSGDPELLPPWAKFVRGTLDSPELQPNAARDNVRRDEAVLPALREALGRLVLERLSRLAREEPERMAQLCRWHHYHLKGIAYIDDAFFDHVAELLFFESNRGPVCLRELLAGAQRGGEAAPLPLRYVSSEGAAGHYFRVAEAREWVVIDAGRSLDEALLRKFAARNPGRVELAAIDAASQTELFEPLPPDEAERYRRLEADVEAALRSHRLGAFVVSVRRFAPASTPALALVTPESEADHQLEAMSQAPWVEPRLAELTRQVLRDRIRPLRLMLNADHPLVRDLACAGSAGGGAASLYLALALSAFLHTPKLLVDRTVSVLHAKLVELLGELARRGGEPAEPSSGEARVA